MVKSIILSFSRNNPITAGHQKLFDKVASVARDKKGTAYAYMSQTHDAKKNPIPHSDKVKLAKQLMPNHARMFQDDKSIRTFIDMLKKHSNPEAEVFLIAGSDRVAEYDRLCQKYNGKDYTYKKITVVSAGERDPDAEGVTGISGTKMREFALSNKYTEFKNGAPVGAPERVIKQMFDIIRTSMKASIKESFEIVGKMYYNGGVHQNSKGYYDYSYGTIAEAIEFAQTNNYLFEPLTEVDINEAIKGSLRKATKQIKIGNAKNKVEVNPEANNYGRANNKK